MANIVGLSGSPRKGGNTDILVQHALEAASDRGVDIEFITLAEKDIRPCQGCYGGRQDGSGGKCVLNDDLPAIFDRLAEADGIIIGSPVYFLTVTAQLKAVFDRGLVLRYGNTRPDTKTGGPGKPEFVLGDKVGGAIAVAGGNGQQLTLLEIIKWMVFQNMIVVGDNQDLGVNVIARQLGDISSDEAGLLRASEIGSRIAELVKRLENGRLREVESNEHRQ